MRPQGGEEEEKQTERERQMEGRKEGEREKQIKRIRQSVEKGCERLGKMGERIEGENRTD